MAADLRITDHPILGALPETETLTLTFDGVAIEARAGEPIAAALLANGIRGFRTMPETKELRGVFTGVGRSLEELGTVNGEANISLMATRVEPDMAVETQLGLGSWEERS